LLLLLLLGLSEGKEEVDSAGGGQTERGGKSGVLDAAGISIDPAVAALDCCGLFFPMSSAQSEGFVCVVALVVVAVV
jgi:hypothetical protein